MPTIKTKKEMNLSELIEWGFRNNIENESYKTNDDEGYELHFDAYGTPRFSIFVNKHDTFTVEVEEEITEDAVIPKMLTIYYDDSTLIQKNKSLQFLSKTNLKSAYIMNDDMTMTLLWKYGKMI